MKRGDTQMGRRKEPLALLEEKGKKHLTKLEREERKNAELDVENKGAKKPDFLPKKFENEFDRISKRLEEIGIMTDLDSDSLARYIVARDLYEEFSKKLLKSSTELDDRLKYSTLQNRYFKQCRDSANDLGLSISSRCRLTIPKVDEDEVL